MNRIFSITIASIYDSKFLTYKFRIIRIIHNAKYTSVEYRKKIILALNFHVE